MSKRDAIIKYLRQNAGATAREVARALGYIDGRDVATQLKWLEHEGVVRALPESHDDYGRRMRTHYSLATAPQPPERNTPCVT